MHIFKDEKETKRVIFNIDARIAQRLERAKRKARKHARKLNVDEAVDAALGAFLAEAERRLDAMEQERKTAHTESGPIIMGPGAADDNITGDTTAVAVRRSMVPDQKKKSR